MASAQSAPLLVQKRTLALLVPDLEAAAQATSTAAEAAGGSVQSRNGGELSVAVPEAHAEEFERRMGQLGDVERASAQSDDVAFRAADLESAARAARSRRAELMQLREWARSVPEGLLVEQRLAGVDTRLATLESDLRALRQRASRILFAIELREKPVEALPTVRLPFPWLATLSGTELASPTAAPSEDASDSGLTANVEMSLGLEGRWLADRPREGEDSRALVLALHLRAARTDPLGIAAGYDARLGGLDGFAYEFRGFVGVGTAIGSVVTLGLLGGVGVSGWSGDRVPSSLELPAELFALFDFEALGRLSLYGQPRWTITREARRDGARHAAFADEVSLGAALLLPVVFGNDDLDEGGLRLGFDYSETLGTKEYGVSAGIGFGFPSH